VSLIKHSIEVARLFEQCLEVLYRLLLGDIESELLQKVTMDIAMLDIRDICVHHECDKVQNEVGGLAQNSERGKAVRPEASVVRGLCTSHCIDHLLADLDSGWIRLWVTAKYVPKIDVEEVPIWSKEEIVQMTITDSENICNHTVTRCKASSGPRVNGTLKHKTNHNSEQRCR
jgi:hypothetical protein